MPASGERRSRFGVLTGFRRDRSFGTTVGRRAASQVGPVNPSARLTERGSPTTIEADA
jgi:hypothetical protein